MNGNAGTDNDQGGPAAMSDGQHMNVSDRFPEYPNHTLEAIEKRAGEEFAGRVEEHGRGKNWIHDEPRDHIFKAVDELFLARGCEGDGDLDGMKQHCANAVNHITFAFEIVARDGDHEQ